MFASETCSHPATMFSLHPQRTRPPTMFPSQTGPPAMIPSCPWYQRTHRPSKVPSQPRYQRNSRSVTNSRKCVLHRTFFARNPTRGLSSLLQFCHSAHFCSTSPKRLDTGLLVIDFDMSEYRGPRIQGDDKKGPHERTVRQCPDNGLENADVVSTGNAYLHRT